MPAHARRDRLKLLGGSQAGLHTDLSAVVHQGAERLVHHDLVERQRCERGGYALDEIDAVLLSAAFDDVAVSGFSDALRRKMLSGVGSDRVEGDPITSVEFGVVFAEGRVRLWA